MVHKSGQHFDPVNWWIAAAPVQVAGMYKLAFHGDTNGCGTGGRATTYVCGGGRRFIRD